MLTTKPLTIVFAALLLGCDSSEPEPETQDVQMAPPLEEISYDALGGGKLVFHRNSSEGRVDAVYVVDADARTSWGFTGGLFVDPCVSPDGRQIAFSRSDRGSIAYDVFLVDIDGANLRNPFPLDGQAYAPGWTPDSRHVIYSDGGSFVIDSTRIHIESNVGTLDPHRLRLSASTNLDLLIPASMVFAQPPSIGGVYLLRAGSSSPELWIAPDSTVSPIIVAAWSPDDEDIAFAQIVYATTTRNGPYTLQLWIMDKDRGNRRLAAEVALRAQSAGFGGHFSLAWSPDGSRIAFALPETTAPSHIFIASADGAWVRQITTADGAFDGSVSWSR